MEQKLQGEDSNASLIKQLKTYSGDSGQYALTLLLTEKVFALLAYIDT